MRQAKLVRDLTVDYKNGKLEALTIWNTKELKGKRIQGIYFGYAGQDGANDFVIGDLKTDYELAQLDTDVDGFANRAEYWESYMNESQLSETKELLNILDADGNRTYIKAYKSEGIFWCSDENRPFYFREYKDPYVDKTLKEDDEKVQIATATLVKGYLRATEGTYIDVRPFIFQDGNRYYIKIEHFLNACEHLNLFPNEMSARSLIVDSGLKRILLGVPYTKEILKN